MDNVQTIDTFPAFLTFWAKFQDKSINDLIEGWAGEYMSQWPDLLAKQIEDYESQNLDWREIAREKVFPHLPGRIPDMHLAHQNLLESCEPIYSKAEQALGFGSTAIFVFYAGIGCGAGWATQFRGSPAILFGLENIAESGWSDRSAIQGLVAHETGHLAHSYWRTEHGKPNDPGPWWQLYEEGFAQYCESLILDVDTWHQAIDSNDNHWLDWCRTHSGWLASEFLRTVDEGKPVSQFFGSWLDIRGKSETGYFLGYEVIKELKKQFDLKEIALMGNTENSIRPILERMSEQGN